MQLRSAITKCALPSGSCLGFGFVFFPACAKELHDSCCKRALGRTSSLAFLLLSVMFLAKTFASIRLSVQLILVLSSLKIDSNCTLVTKICYSHCRHEWCDGQTDHCQYCSISFVLRACLRDEQICFLQAFFMEMVTLSNTEAGCRISVLREAQTWLDSSLGSLSSLDLLWAGGWTRHLQRALLKHVVL